MTAELHNAKEFHPHEEFPPQTGEERTTKNNYHRILKFSLNYNAWREQDKK